MKDNKKELQKFSRNNIINALLKQGDWVVNDILFNLQLHHKGLLKNLGAKRIALAILKSVQNCKRYIVKLHVRRKVGVMLRSWKNEM